MRIHVTPTIDLPNNHLIMKTWQSTLKIKASIGVYKMGGLHDIYIL